MIDNAWMIKEIAEVAGVCHVVVFTADGLPKFWSQTTERDDADRIAATGSGLQSLGRSVGSSYGRSPAVREVMIGYDGGFLFIRAAAERSHLAVVTRADIDPRLVSQQMQTVIQRLGEQTLATPARTANGT
ncbi:roadblock/LC7 domain-containing protein [Nonomuraea sp. NPDC003754]